MSFVSVKNKNILLVGATGILGRTYAKTLADEGANLVLADLPSSDVETLAKEIRANAIHIDLSEENQIIDAVAHAEKHLGNLDSVISNAALTGEGIQKAGIESPFAPFEESSLELWQKTLDINLTGSYILARESCKVFKRHGKGGNLILVSSIYGILGPDHRIYEGQNFSSFAAYSASKAGIIGLTQWLATYLAKDNIRVNCIAPGGVFNNHNESFEKAYSNRIPMGRMANPEDMTGILIYLLSEASKYCTGGIYPIDGGLSAW